MENDRKLNTRIYPIKRSVTVLIFWLMCGASDYCAELNPKFIDLGGIRMFQGVHIFQRSISSGGPNISKYKDQGSTNVLRGPHIST